MARVTTLPQSESIGTVDVRDLLRGRTLPGVDPKTGAPSELRSFVVSEDPRIVVVPQFLSQSECRHLLELADGTWTHSLVGQLVYDNDTAPSNVGVGAGSSPGTIQSTKAPTRTSSSCMLRPAQTSIVERLEHRLASLAKLPIDQLERPVVVRYAPGEQFSEHHDGKFRPRTIFIYLNDLPEGDEGDTFFPHLGFSFVPREGCAVMWSNATPEGVEDSRMVHAGRPPLKAVKYGVNCFFNDERMRLMTVPKERALPEEAFLVDLQTLRKDDDLQLEKGQIRTFALQSEPKLVAVPGFASGDEVEHLLSLAEGADRSDAFFSEGTILLRTIDPEETPIVKQLEIRLAGVAHFPLKHLGRLRVVRSGTSFGMCNRGCGQRCALVCLSDSDEVLFPYLGLRLLLQRGDLLFWPNAWFEDPISNEPGAKKRVVEDMRTLRVHLPGRGHDGGSSALSLDASFHDTSFRAEERQEQTL